MEDVFISYSRKDKAFATRLHEALQARQREAWVDLEDIAPTAAWREKIKAGIEGARAFVFVLSPDSMASPECLKEVEHAAASHKRLIPVVCREVDSQGAPEALGCLNWISMREQDDFETGVDILLTAVDTDLEWVDAHTSLLEKAAEWDRKSRDKSLLLRGAELKEAEGWQVRSADKEPKPTELMATFIGASRQGESRRQRYLLGAVSGGLVVALVLAALAFYQYRMADKRGKIALSRQLAAQASILEKTKPELSLLLAVEAYNAEKTFEARNMLFTLVESRPQIHSYFRGPVFDPPQSLAFSRDQKQLLSTWPDHSAAVWDLETGQLLRHFSLKYQGEGVALGSFFSPGGHFVVLESPSVLLFDGETGKPVQPPWQEEMSKLAFNQDDSLGATLNRENSITIWDMKTGRAKGQIRSNPQRRIGYLAINRQGTLLATGDDGGTINLWNPQTFQRVGQPMRISGGVNYLDFSPDGNCLISCNSYNEPTTQIWDVKTCLPRRTNYAGSSGTWHPNSKIFAYVSIKMEYAINVCDTVTGELIDCPIKDSKGLLYPLAFSPDGKVLAWGNGDGTITLWEMGNARESKIPEGEPDKLARSSDGRLLAIYYRNRDEILIWDMEKGALVGKILEVKDVDSMEISTDNHLLAIGTFEETFLFNLVTGQFAEPRFTIMGSHNFTFWPHRNVLVRIGNDYIPTIALDVRTYEHDVVNLPVRDLVFRPDGKAWAAIYQNDPKKIYLQDSATGQSLAPPIEPEGHIYSLAFSPDGKRLAAGVGNNVVLWDLVAHQQLASPLLGHKSPATLLAFSPNGEILVSACSGEMDQSVLFWDLQALRPFGPKLEINAPALAFGPDGSLLVIHDYDKKGLRLLDMSEAAWVKKACRMANRNLSRAEWRQYLGDEVYRKTCPNLPGPEDGQAAKSK